MTHALHLTFALALLLAAPMATAQDLTDDETIRHTLPYADPDAPGYVFVDLIDGAIEIVGTDGGAVELVARRRTKARSPGRLRVAQEEVRLDLEAEGNEVIVFMDHPCRDDDRGMRALGYEVTIDIELRVPRRTHLTLKTVTGSVNLTAVHGNQDVEVINGGLRAERLRGSADLYALNGDVEAHFDAAPTTDSRFGSLNGDLAVRVPPGLDADLRTKTFNGDVYTNLELTHQPAEPVSREERRDGRTVYRHEGFTTYRAGRGGPTLTFDAFNGDIRIVEDR